MNNEIYSNISFNELGIRLVKMSSIYGGFRFFAQFGNFFIIPIYWHYLSPEDYGLLGVSAVLQGVLTPVINMGLNSSIDRFYFEWKEVDRRKKLGSIWILSLIMSLVIVILIEFSSNIIFPLLFKSVPYNPYFRVTLISTLLLSLSQIPFSLLRITERSKVFGIMSLFTFLINAGINILLLSVWNMKALGMLYGSLVTNFIFGCYWIYFMRKQVMLNFDFPSIVNEIKYAIPSIPISFVDALGNNFDRYYLEKYLSLNDVGIYSLGNRFGNYFNQVNSSLKTAFFPITYKLMELNKNFKSILPQISMFYFNILTIFALVFSLLLKEVVTMFGGDKFSEVYTFIPAFILLYLTRNFGTALGRGLDLVKKPILTLISIIPSIVVSISLMVILIPRLGSVGAIIALLISALVKSAIYVMLAHYYYPRRFLTTSFIITVASMAWCFSIGAYISSIYSIYFSFFIKVLLICFHALISFCGLLGFEPIFVYVKKSIKKMCQHA